MYSKDKHDFGLLRQDGTTKVGFIVARDKNGVPIYQTFDDEYLARQQTQEAGYDALIPEKEFRIGQDDFRAGFGLNIYDPADPKRYLDSRGMDMRHRGMAILGTKPTAATLPDPTDWAITDAGLEVWTGDALDNWTETGNGGALTKESTIIHSNGGSFSAQLNTDATGGAYERIDQNATGTIADWKGKYVIASGWMRTATASRGRFAIADGQDTSYSAYHTGGDTWEQLFVVHKVNASATILKIYARNDGVSADVYADDIAMEALGVIKVFAEFNAYLYFSAGRYLMKLDKTTGAITTAGGFIANITDLEAFTDDNLYIALGASNTYWYASTAEAFTEEAAASKAYFFKAVGTTMWKGLLPRSIYSSTDPTADVNWSGATTVDSSSYDILELLTDGTTLVVKKEDRSFYISAGPVVNILIGETKHLAGDTSGRCATEWQGKYYIGCGTQGLVEYDGGTITWRSPSKFCNNLSAFAGKVMAVAGDEEYLFAILDNGTKNELLSGRLETIGTTTSWAWHPIQELTLTPSSAGVESMLISSVTEKRVYITSTSSSDPIYYMPLPTGYGDVITDANRSFLTAGYFITPFMHAKFKGDSKAFIKTTLDMGGTSSTVYFTVEYQLFGSTNWTEINPTDKFGKVSPYHRTTAYIPVDDISSAKPVSTMIRFKITGVTGATTSTPILYGYDVRGILYPTRRNIIYTIVRCADGITLNGGGTERDNDAAHIKATLEEAKNTATWPVTMYEYKTGTTKYVRLLPTSPFSKVVKDEVSGNLERHFYLLMQEVALS